MHPLFSGTVHQAARRLLRKTLVVNGHTCTITDVHVQTAEDNARWIRSKPLFGTNPVDVYVSKFRGAILLFLRTEELNTCVRIDEIELDGQVFEGPTKVCRALGITNSLGGDLTYDGTTIQVTWRA